jgi:hypothetical protein
VSLDAKPGGQGLGGTTGMLCLVHSHVTPSMKPTYIFKTVSIKLHLLTPD